MNSFREKSVPDRTTDGSVFMASSSKAGSNKNERKIHFHLSRGVIRHTCHFYVTFAILDFEKSLTAITFKIYQFCIKRRKLL